MFYLEFCNLAVITYQLSEYFFLLGSLRFSTLTILASAYRDRYISSLRIYMHFISSPCLYCSTSSTVVNKSSKRHLCLVLDIRRKALCLTALRILKYHIILPRIPIIQETEKNNWQRMKLQPLCIASEKSKIVVSMKKSWAVPQRVKHTIYHRTQQRTESTDSNK